MEPSPISISGVDKSHPGQLLSSDNEEAGLSYRSDETASYIPLAVLLAAVVSFHQDLYIVPQFLILPKANYKTDSAIVVAKMVATVSGYILVLCLLHFDQGLISLCVQKHLIASLL